MALDPGGGRRSISPTSSGRSSPAPRAARRTAEDGVYKTDKALRRYGATIERALASWEISPQEWADYIAFLGRLLKAIQTHPKDVPLLPHSEDVASKLAQCLNPALPSGVHQKALEVYAYIFSTFGREYICGHLHEFLPGISTVLSFASLSVRPAVYGIYEDYVTNLPTTDLRPVLKSLILSLLPAIEEATSEDFERAFRILEKLEQSFSAQHDQGIGNSDKDGYFWQCLFLAIITSNSRRQGALNYLTQKLPKFVSQSNDGTNSTSSRLAPAANSVISPEPGLLIRCFVCGLSDPNILVQRGFLDLLVTNLPLESPLLQERVGNDNLDRLVSASIHVLLRREMSLNRRLWTWFLGPDPKAIASDTQPSSPLPERKPSMDMKTDSQFKYFSKYGWSSLQRCVLAMFRRPTVNATEKARPFRVCLSLMDRWEIGGSIVPQIFLPAVESAYRYNQIATRSDIAEVIRSASLFFDGIEASLIWARLFGLLRTAFSANDIESGLQLFSWIIENFNVKDEEMLTTHVPYATIYLLILLDDYQSGRSSTQMTSSALTIVSSLLDMIPERALRLSQQRSDETIVPAQLNLKSTRAAMESFYQSAGHTTNDEQPVQSQLVPELLYELTTSLLQKSIEKEDDACFYQVISLLLLLLGKAPSSTVLRRKDMFNTLLGAVRSASDSGRTLSFPTIHSILALTSALHSAPEREPFVQKSELADLEPSLTLQLWQYLSPSNPKYHVEATRSIWQLQDMVAPHDCLQASLVALIRQPQNFGNKLSTDQTEAVKRFATLWNHTIPVPASSSKSGPSGYGRRGSAMPSMSDTKQTLRRQLFLNEPLMLVLDMLNDAHGNCLEAVETWLQSLPSLGSIFTLHFDAAARLMVSVEEADVVDDKSLERLRTSKTRDLEYILSHFLGIVRHGNDWVWQCLNNLRLPVEQGADLETGYATLADFCCRFLGLDEYASHNLETTAIEVLDILLSGPYAISLKTLELDSLLMDRLMAWLSAGREDLQGSLLKLVTKALKVRLTDEPLHDIPDPRQRLSTSLKRPSITDSRPNTNESNTIPPPKPPPQLLRCLQMGFSAMSARPHLDQWLVFLSAILPIFSDAIFTSLIPLVECFCNELRKAYEDISLLAATSDVQVVLAPEMTIIALLEGLDMILARAHECLLNEYQSEPISKPAAPSRSLLSNVTSGVFKAEGPPSRTAQANSRLTVLLTFQDSIRVSLKLWIWASHCADAPDFNKSSAATTAYNALRVRNRTRHLLEQIFAVEPLESLEVIIASWCYTGDATQGSAALDLLHVMQGSRPKNTVPAILDSLCSRTNPTLLPPARRSSQTIDLSAQDIASFLSAYLQSLEDDAMDEIWSDCMAFLRDVLANPLPYRLALPSLLSIILLLAQKVDNTNFGEQRKMRRDLGDVFLRLLSATFTAIPSGYISESGAASTSESDSSSPSGSRKDMSLVAVLNEVTENMEVILETADRITSAVNTISSSLVAPIFRAKSFPGNVNADVLGLLLQISKKAPSAKPWKKELLDVFNDPRLLASSSELMAHHWFPVFHQWCLYDKERMQELLARLTPPSSAGIMFGVGASAARLEADRKTQLNLRRIAILLLSSPEDSFAAHLRVIEEKLVELFEASPSSSPSSMIKAELFMLCRALVLATSTVHLAPIWPIINDNLQAALMSLLPNAADSSTFGNLSLFQACKLLDLLISLSPDEFQLHEWLYITDTIDAVYQPPDWTPTALSDQVANALASDVVAEGISLITPTPTSTGVSGRRRLLISNDFVSDKEDVKAMIREDFARVVLKPFLSQLSIHAYEGVYSMDTPDVSICKRNLLEDILDLSTIVE